MEVHVGEARPGHPFAGKPLRERQLEAAVRVSVVGPVLEDAAETRRLHLVGVGRVGLRGEVVTHTAFWIGFPLLPAGGVGKLIGLEGLVVAVEAAAFGCCARSDGRRRLS